MFWIVWLTMISVIEKFRRSPLGMSSTNLVERGIVKCKAHWQEDEVQSVPTYSGFFVHCITDFGRFQTGHRRATDRFSSRFFLKNGHLGENQIRF